MIILNKSKVLVATLVFSLLAGNEGAAVIPGTFCFDGLRTVAP